MIQICRFGFLCLFLLPSASATAQGVPKTGRLQVVDDKHGTRQLGLVVKGRAGLERYILKGSLPNLDHRSHDALELLEPLAGGVVSLRGEVTPSLSRIPTLTVSSWIDPAPYTGWVDVGKGPGDYPLGGASRAVRGRIQTQNGYQEYQLKGKLERLGISRRRFVRGWLGIKARTLWIDGVLANVKETVELQDRESVTSNLVAGLKNLLAGDEWRMHLTTLEAGTLAWVTGVEEGLAQVSSVPPRVTGRMPADNFQPVIQFSTFGAKLRPLEPGVGVGVLEADNGNALWPGDIITAIEVDGLRVPIYSEWYLHHVLSGNFEPGAEVVVELRRRNQGWWREVKVTVSLSGAEQPHPASH